MLVEIRVCKPIDENTAEFEHCFYSSNLDKLIYKLHELFAQEQQQQNNNNNNQGENKQ
jgi:hypothetical protein